MLLLLLACTKSPSDGETGSRGVALVEQRTLPRTAEAVVLLAALDADGVVSVEGTLRGPQHVDLDQASDSQDAFRYVLLDSEGERLYERSFPSPVLVRDFLAYYSELSGFDVLAAASQLGRFPVQVPLLPEASEVLFEIRDAQGVFGEVGRYDLGRIDQDASAPSEIVLGTETLWESGPSARRLDIVLVGDGYTAEQQELWRAQADELAQTLLSSEPLASYADWLNIRRVDALSQESGASFDCVDDECVVRDTAFGSIFPIELVNRLTGADYDSRAVLQERQWEVARAVNEVPWDLVIVVVNSSRDSGMAVHYATVTTGGDWQRTAVHEFGHLLGLLGDEYVSDACIISPSMGLPRNISDSEQELPWAHLVDEVEGVGAWPGAYNCPQLFRPEKSCRMRSSSSDRFCAVCSELQVGRLLRYVDPVDAYTARLVDGVLELELEGPMPVTVRTEGLEAELQAALPELYLPPPEATEHLVFALP